MSSFHLLVKDTVLGIVLSTGMAYMAADYNGPPEETAWADVIEHGYHLEFQTAQAKRWLGRINTQFNTGYFLEDFE